MNAGDESSTMAIINEIMEQRPSSVTTAVRIRPPSVQEVRNENRNVTSVEGNSNDDMSLNLLDPTFFTRKRDYDQRYFERQFKYDFCFWHETTQEQVYERIGKPLVQHALDGFNCCILAYGQTGSGKTYTMIGDETDDIWGSVGAGKASTTSNAGVIPRLCQDMLETVHEQLAGTHQDSSSSHTDSASSTINVGDMKSVASSYQLVEAGISVSFYEIYNEKVHDLLSRRPEDPCRVREHPEEGAYIEGITTCTITSLTQAAQIMLHGLKQRAVAATKINSVSSRSHAVYTIYLKQKLVKRTEKLTPKPTMKSATSGAKKGWNAIKSLAGVKVGKDDDNVTSETTPVLQEDNVAHDDAAAVITRNSKVTLVDLAGSERVSLTGATGERLVEANNINKSLSTLSDVIKALSDRGASHQKENELTPTKGSNKDIMQGSFFVPYRNSILTWLLKDCLGGNARTSMLANVSPCENSYNETMSTLRYVERAKLIMNTARINETSTDPAFVVHLQKQLAISKERISELNAAQLQREQQYHIDMQQLEDDLERQFIVRTEEMRDELTYYKNRVSNGIDSQGSSIAGGGYVQNKESSASVADTIMLKTELSQVKVLNQQQARIIAQYEVKEGLSESSSTNSSSSSSSSPPNRMKGIVMSYKRDKDVMSQQCEQLLAQCRTLTIEVEGNREQVDRMENNMNSITADLSLARADRNRLKSELAHRVEEVNTKMSELEYYKGRLTSSAAEHKRKIALLEVHISKAKDAESSQRHEREADMDKFTELLADLQQQVQEVDKRIAEAKAIEISKTNTVEAKLKVAMKEKDRLRQQMQSKSDELDSASNESFRLKEDIKALELKVVALRACEKDLEDARAEIRKKQSSLTSLHLTFDEHKLLLLSEQKKLTEAFVMLGDTNEIKSRLERDILELNAAKTDFVSQVQRVTTDNEALEHRQGKLLEEKMFLQQQVEVLTADKSELHKQTDALTIEIDSLQQQLQDLEIKRGKQFSDMQNANDLAMAKATEKITGLHEQLRERLVEMEKVEVELQSWKDLEMKKEEELALEKNSKALLQAEVGILRQDVEKERQHELQLENALSSEKAEEDRLNERLEQLKLHLVEEKASTGSLMKKVMESEKNLAESQEKLHESVKAEALLIQEKEVLNRSVVELNTKVSCLEVQVKDGDGLVKSIIAKHEIESDTLRDQFKKAEVKCQLLETSLTEATCATTDIEKNLSMLREELTKSEAEVIGLTKAQSNAKIKAHKNDAQITNLERENHKLEELVRENDGVVKHLLKKHEEETAELHILRKQAEKEAYLKSMGSGNNQEIMIDTLREQIVTMEAKVDELEEEKKLMSALDVAGTSAVSTADSDRKKLHEQEELISSLRKEQVQWQRQQLDKETILADRESKIIVKDAAIAALMVQLKSKTSAENAPKYVPDPVSTITSPSVDACTSRASISTTNETLPFSPEAKKKRSSIFSGAKKGWNVIRSIAGVAVKKEKEDDNGNTETTPPASPSKAGIQEQIKGSREDDLERQLEALQAQLTQREAELLESNQAIMDSHGKHDSGSVNNRFFVPMSARQKSTQEWKIVHSMIRWENSVNLEKLRHLIEETPNSLLLRDPKSLNYPIHIAAQNGHEEATALLLATANVDVNVKNCTGQTPLHMAMAYDYDVIVKMLLEAGADESIYNHSGFAAITGINGDKTTGLLALAHAQNSQDVNKAMDMIDTQIGCTNIADYVKISFETRRNIGHLHWGASEKIRFTKIFRRLHELPLFVSKPLTAAQMTSAPSVDDLLPLWANSTHQTKEMSVLRTKLEESNTQQEALRMQVQLLLEVETNKQERRELAVQIPSPPTPSATAAAGNEKTDSHCNTVKFIAGVSAVKDDNHTTIAAAVTTTSVQEDNSFVLAAAAAVSLQEKQLLEASIVSLEADKVTYMNELLVAHNSVKKSKEELLTQSQLVQQLNMDVLVLKTKLSKAAGMVKNSLGSPPRKLTGSASLEENTDANISSVIDGEDTTITTTAAASISLFEEYTVHTHDDASLTEELISTKMSLALSNSELEQCHFDAKNQAKTIEELRELIDTLRSQLEAKLNQSLH